MKQKLLFLIAFIFLLAQNGQAQTSGFLYSSIRCTIQSKQDSLLLLQNERKMWAEAKKGSVMMFDNPMLDCEFKVRMSQMAIQACLKDSIATKSGASQYMMNLMQNRNADSCYLMSFSPFLTYSYQERGPFVFDPDTSKNSSGMKLISGHYLPGPWKTGYSVRFLMPLSSYAAVLTGKELANANTVYREQLASQLGGKLSGDTIYRIVRFMRDSNEYLPQAPYANLLVTLKNLSLAGKTRVFPSRDLAKPLSKIAMESLFVAWDSTNQVEDPNNPGVYILAPIKREGRVQTLLIYEKWNFFSPGPRYFPTAYLGMQRTVSAYGLLLDSGKVLWFSAENINKLLLEMNFNMIPYEECFRAERFKTLQVQVHDW